MTSIEIEPEDDDVPILWVLPECIYPYLNSLSYFRARNVIILGNASIASGDPLLRLSPTIDTFTIRFPSVLRNPTKTYSANKYPYAMDWTRFFNQFPLLEDFEISGAQLTGSLPSSLPALIYSFSAAQNSLSGSIPAGLFSNLNADTESINLDIGGNALTGTIPSTLFSFANSSSSITSLQVWINDNKLSGSVPVGIFASNTKLELIFVSLSNNQLTGTLPSNTFPTGSFPSLSNLRYLLAGNQLTGDIPNDLFAPLVGLSFGSLSFSVASNQLTGPIPDFWTDNVLNSIYELTLDLSGNRLGGTIPSFIAPSFSVSSFVLNLASNQISGIISSTLMDTPSVTREYTLHLDNNQLEGTLPSTLSMNGLNTIVLSASSNKLTGALPDSFLTRAQGLFILSLNLANNAFGGSIPSDFLTAYTTKSTPYTTEISVNLSNCGLSGEIPASIRGNMEFATIDLSNNILTGNIPSALFASSLSNNNQLTFNAAQNKLTGVLSIPVLSASYPGFYMNVSHNELTELSIAASVMYIGSLDVSYNKNLTGTFPSQLLDSNSYLESFNASHTSMNGEFPDLSGKVLEVEIASLDLSSTAIDFCSGNRTLWLAPTLVSCNLHNTTASKSCSSVYPAICTATETRVTNPPGSSAPSRSVALIGTLLALAVVALLIA